jgi:hypothetical protein
VLTGSDGVKAVRVPLRCAVYVIDSCAYRYRRVAGASRMNVPLKMLTRPVVSSGLLPADYPLLRGAVAW